MDTSDPPSRELTIDEAIAVAIGLQKQQHLAEAEQLYARVLEVAPHHPDALHYTGLLAHQQGRGDEAVKLIEESLALAPNQADWHSNYAIVLQSRGRFDDAIREYERAISINPQHANAHSNLGVLLRVTGRKEEAEAAYRTAIHLAPDHADAYTNLGILLNGLGRSKEASDCFCKALTLRPKHRDTRRLLVLAHCMIGEVDEAVKLLEEWLAEEPGDPIAAHMLAASTGRDVPSRASDAFVVNPSTASPRALRSSSRASRTARRSSSRTRWQMPAWPPTVGSSCWTPGAAPACADRCYAPMHRAWSASTCPAECLTTPGARRSTPTCSVRAHRVPLRRASSLRRHRRGRHTGVFRRPAAILQRRCRSAARHRAPGFHCRAQWRARRCRFPVGVARSLQPQSRIRARSPRRGGAVRAHPTGRPTHGGR